MWRWNTESNGPKSQASPIETAFSPGQLSWEPFPEPLQVFWTLMLHALRTHPFLVKNKSSSSHCLWVAMWHVLRDTHMVTSTPYFLHYGNKILGSMRIANGELIWAGACLDVQVSMLPMHQDVRTCAVGSSGKQHCTVPPQPCCVCRCIVTRTHASSSPHHNSFTQGSFPSVCSSTWDVENPNNRDTASSFLVLYSAECHIRSRSETIVLWEKADL